jgi:gonadotropin-releasing hormone receptor
MLQLIVFHKMKGPFYEEFYQCVTHGSYPEVWHEQTYIMMSFVVMFVLPLAVLICTYFSTVFTIASECSLPLSSSKLSLNISEPV